MPSTRVLERVKVFILSNIPPMGAITKENMGNLSICGPVMTTRIQEYDWRPVRSALVGPRRRKTDTGAYVKGIEYGRPWRAPARTGRNSPCICGSGRKHKNCRLKGLCIIIKKGEIK
jgi:hypothetical protein